MAIIGVVLGLIRAPRSPAGFAAATAFTFILFFAFAKQAFCNYYFLVIGMLCAALAASDRRASAAPASARPASAGPAARLSANRRFR